MRAFEMQVGQHYVFVPYAKTNRVRGKVLKIETGIQMMRVELGPWGRREAGSVYCIERNSGVAVMDMSGEQVLAEMFPGTYIPSDETDDREELVGKLATAPFSFQEEESDEDESCPVCGYEILADGCGCIYDDLDD